MGITLKSLGRDIRAELDGAEYLGGKLCGHRLDGERGKHLACFPLEPSRKFPIEFH